MDTKTVAGLLLTQIAGCGALFFFGVVLPGRYGLHIWNLSDMIQATHMWLR